jgi:plastocyanin
MRLVLVSCVIPVFAATMAAGRPSVEDVAGSTTAEGRAESQSIVWIDAPGHPSRASARVVLDQRNIAFYPRVLAVQVGTTVDFPNHDRVFHNVFSFHDGKRFDLGLYPVGAVRHVRFDHPGLSRVLCNIHPAMAAYVMAVDTAFFAVSDDRGRFVIPDVPYGGHVFHAWRPGRSELSGSVQVTPGATLNVQW